MAQSVGLVVRMAVVQAGEVILIAVAIVRRNGMGL